jgi:hypothetical protein
MPDLLPYVSVLPLDLEKLIGPSTVHVLYGMSKDWCVNRKVYRGYHFPIQPTAYDGVGIDSAFHESIVHGRTSLTLCLRGRRVACDVLPLLHCKNDRYVRPQREGVEGRRDTLQFSLSGLFHLA